MKKTHEYAGTRMDGAIRVPNRGILKKRWMGVESDIPCFFREQPGGVEGTEWHAPGILLYHGDQGIDCYGLFIRFIRLRFFAYRHGDLPDATSASPTTTT